MMFWKKHTEPLPLAVGATEVEQPGDSKLTIEEQARQWFQKKTGEAMPEEFKAWLRQLAHDEAVRVTTSTAVLSPQQIMKLHEGKRLAATKLDNVEQNIETVRRKQDWIARFNDINIRLEENRAALYEAGKHNAALREMSQELERYESFEPIQGLYSQYLTLNEELHQARSQASVLKRQCAEAESEAAKAQTLADTADKLHQDAEAQLRGVMDTLSAGYKMDGMLDAVAWSDTFVAEWHKTAHDTLDTSRRSLSQAEAEALKAESALDEVQARLHAIEAHKGMLLNGGAIMVRLDRLREIDDKREELRRRAVQTAARKRDLDDRMARLFEQDQALVAELHTLQGEMQMHRNSNLGVDGTKLQARTIELKSRRLRLLMARQLWARITKVYNDIDERRQAIDRLSLHLNQNETAITNLTSELRQLHLKSEQRRYTYTVSKSQNVIKLRADLREGTPCSVCGALNHPYHSDTMTEQNRLMSEWKTESEMLDAEARSKEQKLEELKMKHANEQGQYASDQEYLRLAQEEMRGLTRDWAQYEDLDLSFQGCNPGVGAEARTAMFGQLIDNTDQQATETQQELDTYNYHQMAINRVAEQIDDKENRRADLAVALNETNTGCQVVAGGVERIQRRIASLTTGYTTLFGELDGMITINDWVARWRDGHENFKLDLRNRMEERERLLESAARYASRLAELKARIEVLRQEVATQEGWLLVLQRQMEANTSRTTETSNSYARLFGTERAADIYSRTQKLVGGTAEDLVGRRDELAKARARHGQLLGESSSMQQTTARLEAQVSSLHGQLDEWIRAFNTNHPPVQYAELERVFRSGRDWNEQRQAVNNAQRAYVLAQARDEDLRSTMLALQADENRAVDSRGETMEALISQRESLERRRRDIMQEVATIDRQLMAHEQALKQLETLNAL